MCCDSKNTTANGGGGNDIQADITHSIEVVKEAYACLNSDSYLRGVHAAIERGDIETFKKLLEAMLDVHGYGLITNERLEYLVKTTLAMTSMTDDACCCGDDLSTAICGVVGEIFAPMVDVPTFLGNLLMRTRCFGEAMDALDAGSELAGDDPCGHKLVTGLNAGYLDIPDKELREFFSSLDGEKDEFYLWAARIHRGFANGLKCSKPTGCSLVHYICCDDKITFGCGAIINAVAMAFKPLAGVVLD